MDIETVQLIVVIGIMVCALAVCAVAWYLLRHNSGEQMEMVDQWAPIDVPRVLELDSTQGTGHN